MTTPRMSVTADRHAAAKRREEHALWERDRARAEQAEKTARLKAFRLAKKAEDNSADATAPSGEVRPTAIRKPGLPQARRGF